MGPSGPHAVSASGRSTGKPTSRTATSGSKWPRPFMSLRPPPFDGIPDQGRDVGAAEALDLADAGGRGDIDFGEIAADDVDADKDHVARPERRPDGRADF